jgi:hypothetical protein
MTQEIKPKKKPNGCKCPNCDPNRSANYVDYLPPNHIGRPTKYNPHKCVPIAIEVLSSGRGLANLCRTLQISEKSLELWRLTHPEFSQAIEAGLAFSKSWWTESGQDNLGNTKFNANLWNMNMKNRFGWHDQKPSYGTKAIPNYEGTLEQKALAANVALQSGTISVDEHTSLMQSLAYEAKILETNELQKDVNQITEKLGLKK